MKNTKLAKALIVALGLAACLGLGLSWGRSTRLEAGLTDDEPPRRVAGEVAAEAGVDSPAGPALWMPPSPAYKITVNTDGLYELDFNALNGAGLPVGTDPGHLDPRTFRLFWMEQEIPIWVEGEGDGTFDPGDVLLFYGRGVDSLFYEGLVPTNKYTGTTVYWLTYDPTGVITGLRMSTKDGSVAGGAPGPFLHTEHLEQNFAYESDLPHQHDADHWYWQTVTPATPRSYNFTATNIATGTLTGTLSIALQGVNSVEHNLHVEINSNEVLTGTAGWGWGGKAPLVVTVDVPQAYFQEGANTIAVTLLSASDNVYVNWLEVSYYDTYVAEGDRLTFTSPAAGSYQFQVTNFSGADIEVYDVTDMTNVQRFVNTTLPPAAPAGTVIFGDAAASNSRYLALTPTARLNTAGISEVTHLASAFTPTNLLDPANEADYIIITHSSFWTEAQVLAAHRAADYRVALVDVQEIYDYFNGGMMSAESIHDFLAYAYNNWLPPKPSYVVLLGDGTNDMRNYKGTSAPTYIPPYLYLADPTLGETAADSRFVFLEGDDLIPDMHLGRLPANSHVQISPTMTDAEVIVTKIISYETECVCDDWNHNVVFVADNLKKGGGNFYELSDNIADGYDDPPTNTVKYLPAPYTSTKIYMDTDTAVPPYPQPTCPDEDPSVQCKQDIIDTLNNAGALLVNYIGHSTKYAWAAERMFDLNALFQLNNGPCLPVMLAMTCFEGSFHEPQDGNVPLAEAELRIPEHGSVASFSATGFGVATGHDLLNEGLFLALFRDNVGTLGEATTYAKQFLDDYQPRHLDGTGVYDDLLETYLLLGDPGLKVKTAANCPTGVRLAGFSAQPMGGAVELSWRTTDEGDMIGFRVLRADSPDGEFLPINDGLIFANWSGSAQGTLYSYVDRQVAPGHTYRYQLEVVYLGGQSTRHGPLQVDAPWRLSLPLVRRVER